MTQLPTLTILTETLGLVLGGLEMIHYCYHGNGSYSRGTILYELPAINLSSTPLNIHWAVPCVWMNFPRGVFSLVPRPNSAHARRGLVSLAQRNVKQPIKLQRDVCWNNAEVITSSQLPPSKCYDIHLSICNPKLTIARLQHFRRQAHGSKLVTLNSSPCKKAGSGLETGGYHYSHFLIYCKL